MTRKEMDLHLRACRLVMHGMEEEARLLYRRASKVKEAGAQYKAPRKMGKVIPFPKR